jgi:putative membrane protein
MCCSYRVAETAVSGGTVASPFALLVVTAIGCGYALGRDRWNRRARRTMVSLPMAASFGAGLVAVAIAVASPLDTAAESSLSAHMIQHVLLLAVAGPLLALGMPLPTLLWALPATLRRRSVEMLRRLQRGHDRRFAMWLSAALLAEALVMWGWHAPVLYEAALRNPGLHAVEHASFLLVSTAAWWSVLSVRRSLRGAAAVAALLGSLPGMALGVAMVLAPRPWYPAYVTGTVADALANQQLAGVIMWAFGGMAAVIAGVALFASWLASDAPVADTRVPAAIRSGAVR